MPSLVDIKTENSEVVKGGLPMLTIEGLLAVMGLCAAFFGLGFSIGLSLGAKK